MNLLQKALIKAFNLQGASNPKGAGGYASMSDYSNVPASYPWDWWQKDMQAEENRTNTTVEACVATISQTVAMLPLEHFKVTADGGREAIKASPVLKVLRKPNPFQTKSDFFLNFTRQMLLEGNGFGAVTRDHNYAINAIYPQREMHPFLSIELNDVFYSGSRELIEIDSLIPSRDILHCKMHTGESPLIGVTPLEALVFSASTGTSIQGHENRFFTNMSRPSGTLTTDLTLTADQVKSLRDRFNEQAQELATGGLPILTGGLKFEKMSLSAVDSEIIETYKMTKTDIASVYRVPLPLIGAMEASTFNNVESLMKFWISSGLGFILDHIEESLKNVFDLPEDEYINFDTDYLLRSDFLSRMDGLGKAVSSGVYTPNEARKKEGLPRKDNGDDIMLQVQMQPIGTEIGNKPDPKKVPAPDPKDEKVTNESIKTIIKGVFNE